MADGRVAPVLTVFLTNRECPWRCVMCDLWRHTTITDTPRGAITAQLREAVDAIAALPEDRRPRVIKLYNAGSFLDPRAVPERDYPDIAAVLTGFEHIIIESHPSLIARKLGRWLTMLDRAEAGRRRSLEVAMGLETVHPEALDRLHKRMTVDDFRGAARTLARRGVGLRVFLLVSPPFVPSAEQDAWLLRSVEEAWRCEAGVVSLIPTRTGNGALEALEVGGLFKPPRLDDLERSLTAALRLPRPTGARVFADIWDLDRFSDCSQCLEARRARLQAMNLGQQERAPVRCAACSGSA
jgi:radical SAM enzyme (TIGR01210 family)